MSIHDFLISGLEGDIIRVLAMFGGTLWKEEIINEVSAMNRSLGYIDTNMNFDEAISKLEKAGIVITDRRIKGDLRKEDVYDVLVRLVEYDMVLSIVSQDEKFLNYQGIRRKLFEESLK